MAKNAIRGVVLVGLVGSALLAGAAGAQDEGDTVVIVLKSGKKYTCTLVSRSEQTVKVRVGESLLSLPASMITSLEKVEAPDPVPEDRPAPESGPVGPDAPPAGPAGGGEAPEGGPAPGAPKGAAITLKDGRTLLGYVVAKENGKIWIVPGMAIAVDEEDIEEAEGNTEPTGTSVGLVLTGNKAADSERLIKEISSGDQKRVGAAFAVLTSMGHEAIPIFLSGLKSPSVEARDLCIEGLTVIKAVAGIDPLLSMLRNDRDARIRCSVAGRVGEWDPPGARRAVLDAVWQDRDQSVKATGLLALEKTAGPEEVSALIDLMTILPSDSDARNSLFRVLKKATGQKFAPDADLWMDWWNSEGREKTAELADAAARVRYRQEQTTKYGAGASGAEPAPVDQGPPAEVLKGPETPPPVETPPEEPK